MIGTLLANRYQIEAELGRGGMGVVYRAHDSILHRPVAIKVLIDADLGPDGHDQLLKEARAVARLDHPYSVTVYGDAKAHLVDVINNPHAEDYTEIMARSLLGVILAPTGHHTEARQMLAKARSRFEERDGPTREANFLARAEAKSR